MGTFSLQVMIDRDPERLRRFGRAMGYFNSEPFAGFSAECVRLVHMEGRVPSEAPNQYAVDLQFQWLDELVDPLAQIGVANFWQLPGIGEMNRRELFDIVRRQVESTA